jgi:hypothetical protein
MPVGAVLTYSEHIDRCNRINQRQASGLSLISQQRIEYLFTYGYLSNQ